VQRRHPALRAAIEPGVDGRPRFVPADIPIKVSIVQRLGDSQWRSEVEWQLQTPFNSSRGPLLRAMLVQGECISELILAVHHSIGDGISAMFLVRDLLELLEGHELAELPARPPLEAFVGGESWTPERWTSIASEIPRLENPGLPHVGSIDVGPQDLETLLSRCRQEGTTIQGALLAAVLRILRNRNGGNSNAARCLAPVSVRELCPPIADDFGLYISSGIAVLQDQSALGFWSLARHARDEVSSALAPQVLRAGAGATASLLARNREPHSVYQDFRSVVNYDAVLSNLGRFPLMPRVRQFRVTAVYPVLNIEYEPLITVATAGTHMSLVLTSNGSLGTDWLSSVLEEALSHSR
jgi:hypothetical protein